MNDLDVHIRAAIDDIVAAIPVAPAEMPMPSAVANGHQRRGWPMTVATLGAAAALIAALGFVVTRPTQPEGEAPAAAPQPSSSSAPDDVGTPMLLLPASPPAGFRVDQVFEQPATVAAPDGLQRIVIGQRLPDGGFGPTIDLISGPPESILADDGEIQFERRSVTLANKEPAEFLWWGAANERLSLQYISTSGRAVSIAANATTADGTIADLLLAVANATAVVDIDAQVLSPLPDGYEVLATSAQLDSGGPSWSVDYVGIDSSRALTITSRAQPPSGFPFTTGSSDGYTPIKVRGHDGYISSHDYPDCNCPTTVITWLERPDLQITVAGDALTTDELATIADELELADDTDWSALASSAPSSPDLTQGP